MAAAAKRAVYRHIAGDWPEALQDLPDHDGQMGARRRAAARQHFLDVFGVFLWIELFVLVVKLARALARIPPASDVHRGF
jgi:hypothetical protein